MVGESIFNVAYYISNAYISYFIFVIIDSYTEILVVFRILLHIGSVLDVLISPAIQIKKYFKIDWNKK